MAEVAEALLPGGVEGSTADDCKDMGNNALSGGKLEDAIYFYSLGLKKREGCHILHSNRSAAYAKKGDFTSALDDADACVRIKPDWARGHGRRGAALEGRELLGEALKAYEEAGRLDPNNEGTKAAAEGVRKRIKEQGWAQDAPMADAGGAAGGAGHGEGGGGGGGAEGASAPAGEGAAQASAEPAAGAEAEGGAGAAAPKAVEVKKEEVKVETPAEKAKGRGNKAYASGNYEDAIDHYSDAIQHDKMNPVLFSNRSAAYAGAGQMQSALNDAQKCINLKPMWSKGYARKAVALAGLNKTEMAISAYQDALKWDPHNQSLLDALGGLRGDKPKDADVKEEGATEGGEGEKKEGEEGEGKGAEVKKEKEEEKPKAPELPPMGEEEMELLSSFLSQTSDLERKQQVERIIKYRLNPFEVLQLAPDNATGEELNMAYRKLSLVVHPDKCKHSRAEEAFEICKKSLAELQDEDKKGFYVDVMSTAKEEALRELKKKRKREKEETAKNKKLRVSDVEKLRSTMLGGSLRRPGKEKKEEDKGEDFGKDAADEEDVLSQEDQDILVKNTRDAAFRILLQLEKRRARAEKVFVENEKRSKVAKQEAKEKFAHDEKQDEDWNKDRGDRIDSWRDFQQHGKKLGIKKPKPSVTEKGVSVLPPTMGGFRKTKEEEDLEAGGGGGAADDPK